MQIEKHPEIRKNLFRKHTFHNMCAPNTHNTTKYINGSTDYNGNVSRESQKVTNLTGTCLLLIPSIPMPYSLRRALEVGTLE